MNSSDRLDLRRHFRGKYQTERRFGTDLRGHLLLLLLFLLHSGNGACEVRNAIDCERIAESYLRSSIAQHFETEASQRERERERSKIKCDGGKRTHCSAWEALRDYRDASDPSPSLSWNDKVSFLSRLSPLFRGWGFSTIIRRRRAPRLAVAGLTPEITLLGVEPPRLKAENRSSSSLGHGAIETIK